MSELSAEKYIEDILIEGLGVASFIVGNDFRFGHRRAGNFTLLQEKSAEAGFEVIETSAMKGEVEHGQQLGTDLGFPTCNLNPGRRKIPLNGVFACEVRLGDRYRQAAVNIGYRPTITEEGNALLEAHILDFDEDLYGKTIEVIFRKKLREELKFDGLEALKQQMSVDVEQVRELFNKRIS